MLQDNQKEHASQNNSRDMTVNQLLNKQRRNLRI